MTLFAGPFVSNAVKTQQNPTTHLSISLEMNGGAS